MKRSRTAKLLDEGVLGLVEAFHAEGVRISRRSAWLYAREGRHGIKLETMLAGGRRVTSRAAVRRFLEATQPAEVTT